ncbi:MAG TPA: hypothetical protein VIK14_10610 [Ignavibacteria bacterium]
MSSLATVLPTCFAVVLVRAFSTVDFSCGVYFYKLVAGDPDSSGQAFSETKRMVLVK